MKPKHSKHTILGEPFKLQNVCFSVKTRAQSSKIPGNLSHQWSHQYWLGHTRLYCSLLCWQPAEIIMVVNFYVDGMDWGSYWNMMGVYFSTGRVGGSDVQTGSGRKQNPFSQEIKMRNKMFLILKDVYKTFLILKPHPPSYFTLSSSSSKTLTHMPPHPLPKLELKANSRSLCSAAQGVTKRDAHWLKCCLWWPG